MSILKQVSTFLLIVFMNCVVLSQDIPVNLTMGSMNCTGLARTSIDSMYKCMANASLKIVNYLNDNNYKNTEEYYFYSSQAANQFLSAGEFEIAARLFLEGDKVARKLSEVYYIDRLVSARRISTELRKKDQAELALKIEDSYGIDYEADINIPAYPKNIEGLNRRIEYLEEIGDMEQVYHELGHYASRVAGNNIYKRHGSDQHIAALERFIKTSYKMEKFEEIESAAYFYFEIQRKAGRENSDQYQEVQNFLKKGYKYHGKPLKGSKLRPQLPDLGLVENLDSLNKYTFDSNQDLIEYNLDERDDIRYFSKLYVRYLELSVDANERNSTKIFQEILNRAIDEVLIKSWRMPHEEKAFEEWMISQREKWSSYREKIIIDQVGKNSWAYVKAKSSDVKFLSNINMRDKSFDLMRETYELARNLPNKDTSALSKLFENGMHALSSQAGEPSGKNFLKSYVEEIVRSDWGAKYIGDLSGLIQFNIANIEKEKVAVLIDKIEYPNLLDSAQLYPDRAMTFAKNYHEHLSTIYLEECLPTQEDILTQEGYKDEDALVAYVADNFQENPEVVEYLANFTIKQRQFIGLLRERNMLQSKVKSSLEYQQLYDKWEGKRLLALKDPSTSYSILLQRDQDLARLSCELVTKSWKPDKLVDLRKVSRKLNADEALVIIHRYIDRDSSVWTSIVKYAATIISSEETYPHFINIAGGDSLDYEFFDSYQNELRRGGGGKAFNHYWSSINEKTHKYKKIYIVTDGIYNRINLSTLTNSDDEPLLKKVDLQKISHPGALVSKKTNFSKLGSALLIGNPSFGGIDNAKTAEETGMFRSIESSDGTIVQWNPLPFSQLEIEKCYKVLSSSGLNVDVLTRDDATEKKVYSKFNDHEILHIATHAYFMPSSSFYSEASFGLDFFIDKSSTLKSSQFYDSRIKSIREGKGRGAKDMTEWLEFISLNTDLNKTVSEKPTYEESKNRRNLSAGIVLAKANELNSNSDNIITLDEISNLKLDKTKLVVLSACNSGKADLIDGGGIGGLQDMFQAAGVPFMINSLWPVNDEVAQSFMIIFYNNWLGREMDIQKAFRSTQIQLLNEVKESYLWGSFQLVRL